MSNFEMSTWFKEPIILDVETCFPNNDKIIIINHKHLSSHHLEKIEYAVNNYDTMQAEIQDLKNKVNRMSKQIRSLTHTES